MSEYVSVSQFAQLHQMDVGRVRRLIYEGRIDAVKIGSQWAIPANTPKPADMRIVSGKYKNWRKQEGE